MDEPRRTEDSIVEGLPEAKTERIAAMRRDLVDLQKQLLDAQQRIANELQGRAEDAERIEALEARIAQLEAAGGELTKERDAAQASSSRFETQLDDQRKLNQELAAELTSLRDAKALVTSREAELATATSARDELTVELEQAKRELETTRAKARDFASQLVRFGQELSDGVVVATAASAESKPVAPPPAAERPQPPPPPVPRSRPVTQNVEPIEVVAEQRPRSPILTTLLIVGGMVVGCAVTIVAFYMTGTGASDGESHVNIARPPEPVAKPAIVPAVRPAVRVEQLAEPPPAPPPPAPTPAAPPPVQTAPIDAASDGVLVLPASAAGHRLYVDGKVVEVKGGKAVVACGSREIRIGSSGTAHKLDVACGGETTVSEDPR